jgi:hypothetical protein
MDREQILALSHIVRELDDGRLAFYIDHSTLNNFQQCERKFWYRQVRLLGPKRYSTACNIGSWWSDTMEFFYDHLRASQQVGNTTSTPNLRDMVEYSVKAWAAKDMESLKGCDFDGYTKFGGLNGAIEMATDYFNTYAAQDTQDWKILGVEAGFGLRGEVVLYEDKDLVIFWIGKPDLVVYEPATDQLFPVDHKTKDRIFSDLNTKFKPHSQTAGYIWSINVISPSLGITRKPTDRCVINAAGRSKPAAKPKDGIVKPRFKRIYPNYSEAELLEWRDKTVGAVRRMKWCLENDTFNWGAELACHMFSGCEYRRVDSCPPDARQYVEQADLVHIDPWIPYTVDED